MAAWRAVLVITTIYFRPRNKARSPFHKRGRILLHSQHARRRIDWQVSSMTMDTADLRASWPSFALNVRPAVGEVSSCNRGLGMKARCLETPSAVPRNARHVRSILPNLAQRDPKSDPNTDPPDLPNATNPSRGREWRTSDLALKRLLGRTAEERRGEGGRCLGHGAREQLLTETFHEHWYDQTE